MRIIVMSIKDRALDAFSRPVYVPTIGQAARSFADEVNNPQSEIYKHPEDYDLYHVAWFDDEKGTFENVANPALISRGKDVFIKKGE